MSSDTNFGTGYYLSSVVVVVVVVVGGGVGGFEHFSSFWGEKKGRISRNREPKRGDHSNLFEKWRCGGGGGIPKVIKSY